MRTVPFASLLAVFVLLSPLTAHAEYQQKVVFVQGTKSFLMDGDRYAKSIDKPRGYSKDSVLPALLSDGWYIRNMFVNETGKSRNSYGYVVIEKGTNGRSAGVDFIAPSKR